MEKHIILAKRPDLVLKLEKYHLLPSCKKGGKYEGCAKQWAKEKIAPYDTPETQSLAERLPTGWEELTEIEFDTLLDKLKVAIENKRKERLDTPNRGSEKMIKNLVKVAFMGLSTVATLIEKSGMGVLPDDDPYEKKQARQLSFELVLHLINGTDILKQIFREIARTTNTTDKSQVMIAEILKLLAILIVILAAAKEDKDRLKALMSSFNTTLTEGLEKVEKFITEGILEETISGETADGLSLFLQQAKIALDHDEFDGFYEAYKEALGLINLTPEMLIGDLHEIEQFAKKLQTSMTTGMDAETAKIATLSQAM